MPRLLIVIAGLGLLGSAGRCCPVPDFTPGGSIFAVAADRAIPPAYEAFWIADAVSARLLEITADPLRGTAAPEKIASAGYQTGFVWNRNQNRTHYQTQYQTQGQTQDETQDPRAYDSFKLLLGICFAVIAGLMFWVSSAYEELYEKLFGRFSDFSSR